MTIRGMLTALMVIAACGAVGGASFHGSLMGAEAEAASPEPIDPRSCPWDQPGDPIEATLVDDGRTVMLLPTVRDIVVVDGKSVSSLSPGCTYEDGAFHVFEGSGISRVWLFAIVADEEPTVTVDR